MIVSLYTHYSEFLDSAFIADWKDHRPPALVEWKGRYFLRHTDGHYYEATCAHAESQRSAIR